MINNDLMKKEVYCCSSNKDLQDSTLHEHLNRASSVSTLTQLTPDLICVYSCYCSSIIQSDLEVLQQVSARDFSSADLFLYQVLWCQQ